MVRTADSHSANTGSIPVTAANKKDTLAVSFLLTSMYRSDMRTRTSRQACGKGSAGSEQRLEQILAVPYGTKAKMRNAVYCERPKKFPLPPIIKKPMT